MLQSVVEMSNQKWGVWPSVPPSLQGLCWPGPVLHWPEAPGQVCSQLERALLDWGVVPSGGETRWGIAAVPWGCYLVL